MKNIQGGFSLLEIIVTLIVVMIIISITIPFYHNAQAKQESQHIPIKLRMHLLHAKQNAVLYHNNVVICSSEDFKTCSNNAWATGLISFLDLNQNRNLDENEKILQIDTLQLRYGTLNWQGSLKSSRIVFQGDTGLPRGSIGSFYYCSQYDAPHNKTILNMMGLIRHETPTSCSI